MQRTLRRIWDDIRKGENIDLYVTVFAAISLTLLSLLGLAPQQSIAPITLTVLGLIAIALLGSRHSINELLSRISQNNASFFIDEFPVSLRKDFEEASETWLIGISLSRTVKTNYNLIEQKLSKGHKIRVLLVHPEGMGIEVAVNRNYGRRDVAEKSRDIQNTLYNLCDIQKTHGQLEIRTTKHPISYGGYAINPNSDSGILYLEYYEYRLATESLPRFILREAEGRWYDFFKKELATIWNDSQVWTCKNNP